MARRRAAVALFQPRTGDRRVPSVREGIARERALRAPRPPQTSSRRSPCWLHAAKTDGLVGPRGRLGESVGSGKGIAQTRRLPGGMLDRAGAPRPPRVGARERGAAAADIR